jgi:multicomponent Na+:H+ antiporter subunit E
MPVGPPRLSLVGLAAFLGFFLFQSLKGGVQVAWIALRAVPDLRPGVRVLALRLPAGAARTLLVNTMSLLPGTLSAGLAGERLRLHVLDVRLPAEAELRAIEARIAVMFGLELEGGRKRE